MDDWIDIPSMRSQSEVVWDTWSLSYSAGAKRDTHQPLNSRWPPWNKQKPQRRHHGSQAVWFPFELQQIMCLGSARCHGKQPVCLYTNLPQMVFTIDLQYYFALLEKQHHPESCWARRNLKNFAKWSHWVLNPVCAIKSALNALTQSCVFACKIQYIQYILSFTCIYSEMRCWEQQWVNHWD